MPFAPDQVCIDNSDFNKIASCDTRLFDEIKILFKLIATFLLNKINESRISYIQLDFLDNQHRLYYNVIERGGRDYMESAKIFISHSSKDKLVVDALVELLIRAGINESDILSSTTPGTHLRTGNGLYTELRHILNKDNLFVIFLLSENFYESAVCLNEMGAVWIKDAKFQYMVLPGFSFEKIRGVIRQDERLGISLAPIDAIHEPDFSI